MINNLEHANKQFDNSEKYYYRYIREAIEKHGQKHLCALLGVSEKYLYNTLSDGSISRKRRVANKIADTMSANEGANAPELLPAVVLSCAITELQFAMPMRIKKELENSSDWMERNAFASYNRLLQNEIWYLIGWSDNAFAIAKKLGDYNFEFISGHPSYLFENA